MNKIKLLCIGMILGQAFVQSGGGVVKASQQELPEEINVKQSTSRAIEGSKQENSDSPKSIINGICGTAPVSFDQSTGILTFSAGEITNFSKTGYIDDTQLIDSRDVTKIIFEPGVIAPKDCSNLFQTMPSLTDVEGPLDTSRVTDMTSMFFGSTIKNIDTSGWDTSNVTNMDLMFYTAYFLESLDVSQWDTSNVTSMQFLFANTRLSSLDVSQWDTSKVTNMSGMFSSMPLTSIDVSRWDTSNVVDMRGAFSDVPLTFIDVSSWNTSKVVDMGSVFWGTKLNEIDVSGWDTSNVTTMAGLFTNVPLMQITLGEKSKFDGTVALKPVVINDDYTGKWERISPANPTSVYENSDSFMTNYDGSTPGTYVWQKFKPTIVAKDSTLQVGDEWKAEDNFVSATDKFDNPLSFSEVTVTGSVDTSKPGVYPITYTNGSVSQTINVTVLDKKDLRTIKAKDSTLYVGDTWNPEGNFISATDSSDNPLSFSEIKVTGTVDTSKIGVYPITYINESVSQTVNVTVLDKKDLSTIKAKDSTLHVGDKWNAEDNFISAADSSGRLLSFLDVTVTGSVDTSKAGVYPITYTNGGVSQTVNVTVLEKTMTPSSNSKPSNTATLAADKTEGKKLPTTGDSNLSWLISTLGIMVLISVSIFAVLRHKKNK